MIDLLSQQKQHKASNVRLTATLFFTFLRISPFTFGGGVAIIPHIEHEMVYKKRWFTDDEVPTILAIAQPC